MQWRGWVGVACVSVLGHLALFWPVPVIRFSGADYRALNVSLVTPVQPPESLPAGEELKVGRDALTEQDAVEPGPKRRSRMSAGVAAREAASLEADRPEDAGPVARPGAPEVSIESRVGLPGLDAYRFALAKEILRVQRYPRQLLERGGGGVVELKISFPEAANLPPIISVLASSGQQALDEAAIAATDAGVRSLPWPGARRVVRLSVLFEADNPAALADPGAGVQR